MRDAIVVLFILLATPLGTSLAQHPEERAIEDDVPEMMPHYSRAVQLAFDRVADLEKYQGDVLSETVEWLVVTGIPVEQHSITAASPDETEESGLMGAYIWTFNDPSKALFRLSNSADIGQIESLCPKIENPQ